MKANPGKLDYASVGVGSPSHMAGELLKMKLRRYMVHIPYRGGGPAVAAPPWRATCRCSSSRSRRRCRRCAPGACARSRSARAKRTPILPDVPTIAEATGLKDFEVDSWYAVFAPAKTPDEVVARMNKEIATAVARPDVKAKLLEQGADGMSSTPEKLGEMVKREIAEWRDRGEARQDRRRVALRPFPA